VLLYVLIQGVFARDGIIRGTALVSIARWRKRADRSQLRTALLGRRNEIGAMEAGEV